MGLLQGCNKGVGQVSGLIWGLTGEGSTSKLIWLLEAFSSLQAVIKRASVSYWLSAGGCALPCSPLHRQLTTLHLASSKPRQMSCSYRTESHTCKHVHPVTFAVFQWLDASHRSCLQGEDYIRAWIPEGEYNGGHLRVCPPQWGSMGHSRNGEMPAWLKYNEKGGRPSEFSRMGKENARKFGFLQQVAQESPPRNGTYLFSLCNRCLWIQNTTCTAKSTPSSNRSRDLFSRNPKEAMLNHTFNDIYCVHIIFQPFSL